MLTSLISSALGAVFGSFASTAFGAMLIEAVAKVATSFLVNTILGSKQPAVGMSGKLDVGGDVPRSFSIGVTATKGSLVYRNSHGRVKKTPNAYYVRVVALSDLPGAQLRSVFLNGEEAEFDATPHADYGFPVLGYRIKGQDFLWVKFYDGTQVAADPYLVSKFGDHATRPWDATRKGIGVVYAIITARYSSQAHNGWPDPLFVLEPTPLYDVSRDSTAGGVGPQRWDQPSTWGGDGDAFPIVQAYNVLRGISYNGAWFYGGRSLAAGRVPAAQWINEIEVCRAEVAEGEGTAPRYRCGGQISVDSEPAGVLESLLVSCSGRLAEVGGVYYPRAGEPGAAVASFEAGEVIASAPESFTPFARLNDTVNALTATYTEPAEAYSSKAAPPLYDAALEAEDGDRRLPKNIDLPFVTSAEQVQRLMHEGLRASRRERRHTLVLPPKYRIYRPNEVLSYTDPAHGYTDKLFQIDGRVKLSNGNVMFELSEVDNADYAFDRAVDLQPWTLSPPSIVSPAPQVVEDWDAQPSTVVSETGAEKRPAIQITWDGVDQDGVEAVRFEVERGGQVVTDGIAPDVERGEFLITDGLHPGTNYQVRGRLVASSGRIMTWSDPVSVQTPGAGLAVDAPFVMSNTTRRDEIGVMHVDWEVRLTCQTGDTDLFELQRKVSATEWETVGFNETGVFSVLDVYVVNFRARCRNLFGVWGDWTPEQGGVVVPQAPNAVDYAFDNLSVEGSLRLGDGIRAYFGSDDDMAMFHDGFNGAIEVATGQLLLRGPSILGQIDNGAGGWTTIFGAGSGGSFNAYYDGDLKFNTTSVGATLSGRLTLYSSDAAQDNTRLLFARGEAGGNSAWLGIPPWDPDAFYGYMPNQAGGSEQAVKYADRIWTFFSAGVKAMTVASAKVTVHNALKLPDYTVLTRPNAGNSGVAAIIYISDTAAGPQSCVSNGTAWVGQVDGNIIT